MKISKYGVTLELVTEDKLEMIRNWRNDPKIVQYMEYKEYITHDMQLKWFIKINNNKNYYFIIQYNQFEVGLINVRDIDYEKKQGEAGIFIFEDDFLNTTIPFQASLCLYDFCFETLNLDYLVAHILKDNKRAINFNKRIGYKIFPDQEESLNQYYILTLEDYLKNRKVISRII